MVGFRKATASVGESADAVKELADTAREELSGLSAQLKSGAQIAPYLIIGTAIVSVIALTIALIAVSRRD